MAGEGGRRASSWFRGGVPAPFVLTASRQPRARGQLRAAPLVLTASGWEVVVRVCSSEDRPQGWLKWTWCAPSLPLDGGGTLGGPLGAQRLRVGLSASRRLEELPGELRWGLPTPFRGLDCMGVRLCTARAMYICTCVHGQACTYLYAHVPVCVFIHVCVCEHLCMPVHVCTRVSVHVYAGM